MTKYEFTLRFALPSNETDPDDVADRLYGGGCDDALVGIGCPGSVALDFTRESVSAHGAVMSAVSDVVTAIPGSALIEVAPDIVGVTDIADVVGCSRQNIRQLMLSCAGPVPVPIHQGKQSLWHLAVVLDWLSREKQYQIDAELMDLAATSMRVNLAVGSLRADAGTEDELRVLFA
ncbi:MAG: DNA-binding protein [Coriobacteriia bacterium]|nr:DNA-binding protein [Coriobacteriia bacterium]